MRRHDQEARRTAGRPLPRTAAPAPRSAAPLRWIRIWIGRWPRAPIAAAALVGTLLGGPASAEPATALRPGHRVQLAASAAELPPLTVMPPVPTPAPQRPALNPAESLQKDRAQLAEEAQQLKEQRMERLIQSGSTEAKGSP